MNELQPFASPRLRRSTFIYMGIAFVLIFGGWMALQYFTHDSRIRKIELPYRAQAEILEDLGEFSLDGTHTMTLSRAGNKSAAYRYFPEEWPLACRFYADALQPEQLAIIQFNPAFITDNPGVWLQASSLQEIFLENLPDSLVLLDQAAIE